MVTANKTTMITVLTPTYKRPVQLANVMKCFEEQTYSGPMEHIILDDVGQYLDDPRIVSFPLRFRTLGEKRNATAALASGDIYIIMDDDDAYLPNHVETCVNALENYDYLIPARIWIEKPHGRFTLKENKWLFHGGWAFTREAFMKVNGYPMMQSGQDQGLLQRFRRAGLKKAQSETPTYIYRWCTIPGHRHISAQSKRYGYELTMAEIPWQPVEGLVKPKYERDWVELCSNSHGR